MFAAAVVWTKASHSPSTWSHNKFQTQFRPAQRKISCTTTGRSCCCCCCCRRFEKLEGAAPESLEIPAPTSSSSKFAGSLKKFFFQQNPSSHHHYDYTCYKGGYLQYIFHCNVPSYTRLQLDYYNVLEWKQKNSHVAVCSTLLADHRYRWKLLESCARLYGQQLNAAAVLELAAS